MCVSEGKSLKDEDVLQHLPVGTTATFYFRDLGAQISWVTVSTTRSTPKRGTHCAVTVRSYSPDKPTCCTSDCGDQAELYWVSSWGKKGVCLWGAGRGETEPAEGRRYILSQFSRYINNTTIGLRLILSSFLSGLSDRVYRPSGHLSDVLLQGSLHLRTQIWLYHQ